MLRNSRGYKLLFLNKLVFHTTFAMRVRSMIMHVLIHSHKLAAKTAFMHVPYRKQSELNSGSSHFSFNDKSRYK